MKYLIIAIILVLSINVVAQNKIVNTNIFIRVYDLQGKKINKGKIKLISKKSIELFFKGKTIKIPLSKIGKIKTKRSGGYNVAKGALIGGSSLALIGLVSGDNDSGAVSFLATDKAALGLISGGFFGAAVGGITAIFKKSKLYIIDGNEMKLKNFKQEIIYSIKKGVTPNKNLKVNKPNKIKG